MEKQKNQIYLWIHDEINNEPYLIFDSLEQMILGIEKVNRVEKKIEFESSVPSNEVLSKIEEWKKAHNL